MILIKNILSQWLLGRHYHAMCVWPVIFVRPGTDLPRFGTTLNHERIHARQQIEMLWLFFFIWYGLEFLIRYLKHRDRHKAYLALSHEQEAFAHDADPGYLGKRRMFAWLKYL